MTKTVHLITQVKGGSGKSFLTFMLAEKYPDAIVLDVDDSTMTTTRQLAYRNPILVPFLDPVTQRIDRNVFAGVI